MTVILANGSFPTHRVPLGMLAGAERVVCCDGAGIAAFEHGLSPAAIVGDLDSLPREFKEAHAGIIHHNPDQETNDLTKAFEFCVENGWTDLMILGATGKREDHTIANVSLLAGYAEKAPGVRIVTDAGTFTAILPPGGRMELPVGSAISFFSMEPSALLTTRGVKYPVADRAFPFWWCGTLNKTTSPFVEVESTAPVLVYVPF